MGIRFACNLCEHSLNIKRDLAGKIGVCPHCGGKIRIPLDDAPRSQPLADEPIVSGTTTQSLPMRSAGAAAPSAPSRTMASPNTPTSATSLEGSATLDTLETDSRTQGSPLDEPDSQWYVRPPAGGQYGPASGAVLRTWIAENRITGSTLIWRDGWSQWRSARETLPELAEITRIPASINHGVDANDLFDDPLLSNSPVAVQPSGTRLVGDAAIGQQRGNRNQRRMMLVIALAIISIFLIITLIVLALRS